MSGNEDQIAFALHDLSTADGSEVSYEFTILSELEEASQTVYYDSGGNLTIGVGFNLNNLATLQTVLGDFGVPTSQLSDLVSSVQQYTKRSIAGSDEHTN